MVSLEVLRSVVEETEIDLLPPRSRCHELARVIAPKLKELDCSVEVRDGFVEYDLHSLLSSCSLPLFDFLSLSQDEKEEHLKEMMDGKKTFRVLHSWCEVGEADHTVVIDWHARLQVNSSLELCWPLIVEEKNELLHKYHANGRTFGRWLVIPTRRIPYVTRLRLSSS